MKRHLVNIFFNHDGDVQLSKNDTRVPYRVGARAKVGQHTLVVSVAEDGPSAMVDGEPAMMEPLPASDYGFGFRVDINVEPITSMKGWVEKFAK